jgi:hypothetical protein
MKAKSRLYSAFHLRHQEAQAEIESSNPSTIVQGSVERTLAWLNRFRRLTIRYERREDIHLAFTTLGCALICFNQCRRFC